MSKMWLRRVQGVRTNFVISEGQKRKGGRRIPILKSEEFAEGKGSMSVINPGRVNYDDAEYDQDNSNFKDDYWQ